MHPSSNHLAHANGTSPCFPAADAVWTPRLWSDEVKLHLPKDISHADLVRACGPVRLRLVQHEAKHFVQSEAAWVKYVVRGSVRSRNHSHCVRSLAEWRPRSCTLNDVFIWGPHRRPFRGSTYFIPPSSVDDQRKQDAELTSPRASPGSPCNRKGEQTFGLIGGRAVICRNLMGVAYYHSLYETLGSIAFHLDFLRNSDHSTPVRILENVCIPAVGSQSRPSMSGRVCPKGPVGFLAGFVELLGINASRLQHYPWVRQRVGPAVYLDRATFDCSAVPSFRQYWHALKLRSEFQKRLGAPPLPQNVVLVVNRNVCDGGPYCKSARKVARQAEIEAAITSRFEGRSVGNTTLTVHVFYGNGTVLEQARLFQRAVIVVGPHGAGEANYIFCQRHTPVVEYIMGPRNHNSALYVGYAHAFELPYWAIVSNTTVPGGSYDAIRPAEVVDSIALALRESFSHGAYRRAEKAGSKASQNRHGSEAEYIEHETSSSEPLQHDHGSMVSLTSTNVNRENSSSRPSSRQARWLDIDFLRTERASHVATAEWESFITSGYNGEWPSGFW